eukprot:scaffold12505_cov142-Skeletonema_marinoi.AAC.2
MERSANTKPAATEDEEDIAALIYQESQRRKAEAAALAAAAGKNKKKSSTSSTQISTQLLGMAHLWILRVEAKQLQLRGSENHPQIFTMIIGRNWRAFAAAIILRDSESQKETAMCLQGTL